MENGADNYNSDGGSMVRWTLNAGSMVFSVSSRVFLEVDLTMICQVYPVLLCS